VKYFGVSLTLMQWAITGYTLALSAVIPLSGWMSDRFGAKHIFLISIVLFTLGSVLCSLATSAHLLIICRVIQGLGGGMVAPIGIAMIYRLAPEGKLGSLMGMIGVPMLLAPALGPVVSGWLMEYSTWHWIFLINVPVGIIAVTIGLRFLPQFDRKAVPKLDLLGLILAPVSFVMLAYGVNEAGEKWDSPETLTGLILGGITLIAFIVVELRHKHPLLELRVFRSSDFTRGIIIMWATQFALFSAMILIPIFLQQSRGYGSFQVGLILLWQALTAAVFMPLGGRLFDKIGARPLALAGITAIATALFMLSRISADTELSRIIICLMLIGLGMGLSLMSINTHMLQSAPKQLISRVTPLTAALQQIVLSFAASGMIGFLSSKITQYRATASDPLTASIFAYRDTFLLASTVALSGLILALFLRKPRKNQEEHSGDTTGHDPNLATR
jgi:EmrB/QacA subfamily drug resistance transporter